ncbi:MAG: ABC-type molybdate transport system, ATPase component [Planctomycetota bacterium]|nr:ABC-type molybdate transport system, ATPase component [Planctomycetota bacterium]
MKGDHQGIAVEACVSRRVHDRLTLDVTIQLGQECGVVFGPSGAGKTSLLRLIAGLDRPDAGRVRVGDATWFDSTSAANLPLRSRRAGMIFQDDLLFPHLSVSANIRFGLNGLPRAESDRRACEVAELCGVERLLNRRPATLSGGERQRVGLARALAPRPRLLLCDEPVSAIDLDGRFALVDRLREVQAVERLPVLYVTHSPSEAIALGAKLFLLDGGRIIDQGPPLDVLARREGGGSSRLDDVRNVFRGLISDHAADRGETFIALENGPTLVVPFHDLSIGSVVTLAIRSDDLLLARGPILGLSARNVIAGFVDRVLPHGGDAEVIVRTGEVAWIVSVVLPAVSALDLRAGADVHLILKARSCHILESGRPTRGFASA